MALTRRDTLTAAALLPFATRAAAAPGLSGNAPTPPASTRLPDKASFAPTRLAYLDSGTMHPVSLGAKAAVDPYRAERELKPGASGHLDEDGPRAKFARLINAASPDEIGLLFSTGEGENVIAAGLGLEAGDTS